MILKHEEKYDMLATEYAISAREYFMILRLAIYHIDGENLESSYEITQYPKTNEIYKCGVDILNALYKEKQ